MTTVSLSWGVFLCLTFRNDTVPSPRGNGLCPVHFPSNCSWTVGTRTGPHISDHPCLPMTSRSSYLKSRLKDLGKICWDWPEESPSVHTNGSCLTACFLFLNLPSWGNGGGEALLQSWCLKQVSTLVITSLPTTVAFLNLMISCCVGGWF